MDERLQFVARRLAGEAMAELCREFGISRKTGAFDRSMQHHLRTDLFKDGVYDPREAVETLSHGEERHLESMEGRAVLA
jgi:transposase-like protein